MAFLSKDLAQIRRDYPLEAKLDELGKKLEDPANASDMKLVNEYTEVQEALNKEMESWEELSLQLEN